MEDVKLTPLEWMLYGWLFVSAADALWVAVSGVAPTEVSGDGWTGWIVIAAGVAATVWLLRRLLVPSWPILALAMLFYLVQIVELRIAESLYAFQFGPRVKIKIITEPDLVVSLNLVAMICASLYGWSAFRRFEEIRDVGDSPP